MGMTLLERLEQATEGSRELDDTIEREIVGFNPDRLPTQWPMVGDDTPHYTTSLDAALTLVDPEWRWDVRGVFNQQQTKRVGLCRIVTGDIGNIREYEAEARTPALALCIAALRARG